MRFIKKLDCIVESVLDWPRDQLAPEVWEKTGEEYRLKPEVRRLILSTLEFLPENYKDKLYIIGSICTYNYNDRSDIDIHFSPPPDAAEKEIQEWQEEVKQLSGKLIGQHPINYYLHDDAHGYYSDSMYDVNSDKWIKWSPIKMVNLQNYYDKFREAIDVIDLNKAELYRDIIDLEELRDAYSKASPKIRDTIETEISSKIDEINKEIDNYISIYIELKNKRTEILGTDFPDRKTRSDLPENVIFLMIRRYGYSALAKALKDLRNEKDEIGSPQDIAKIKNAFYAREFKEKLNDKIRALLESY
jgi:hypothetical protein